MSLGRRELVGAVLALSALPACALNRRTGETPMYGLIGKMIATPGNRDALIAILLEGVESMPGCLSYIIAADPANADAIWITEAWDGKDSHAASLTSPAVRRAISRAKPLIASFSDSWTTTPIGGVGLRPTAATD